MIENLIGIKYLIKPNSNYKLINNFNQSITNQYEYKYMQSITHHKSASTYTKLQIEVYNRIPHLKIRCNLYMRFLIIKYEPKWESNPYTKNTITNTLY